MPAEQRVEVAKKAAEARWSVPQAMCQGELAIGNLILPCYVLSDERRVFSHKGILAALNLRTGGEGKTGLGNDRLARFIQTRGMKSRVAEAVAETIRSPFKFRLPSNPESQAERTALGYEASVLVELCQAILRARDDGALHAQQTAVAHRADILIRGFARVGVVALVDEATGFQYVRARRALSEILEQFIAKELATWAKTFDDEYYRQIFRLRDGNAEDIRKRPGYFGHLTNDIVYSRLGPAILDELQKKNPKTESGHRRARHHQWLTTEIGHPKLREHLAVVTALMKISSTYKEFIDRLDRVAPRFNETLYMFSVEDMNGTAGPTR